MHVMMRLRFGKFLTSWMSKFLPDYTPGKTSLDRFIGCEAIMAERERRSKRKLVIFELETKNVYMVFYEAVRINKKVEGFYTSGGFSHFA